MLFITCFTAALTAQLATFFIVGLLAKRSERLAKERNVQYVIELQKKIDEENARMRAYASMES